MDESVEGGERPETDSSSLAVEMHRRCDGRKDDHRNETITSKLAEVIHLNRPGSMYNTPLAGHLGWGLGAAIGMKLGRPDATVIAAEGDGSYMFCAPTACHFTAQKYRYPVFDL
jgi:glyoxylate carboligase